MNQFEEFIRGLFSTSEWPPRWNCGYWSELHGWIYIISELLIWTAYFLIPLIILNYLTNKKATLKYNRAYLYFAAFILLCGATHFLDALMFWIPMYRLNAVIRMATAIVSMATVYHLMRILPELFTQRTNIELEREIARRQEAERRLEAANQNLQAFVWAASHDLQEPLRKVRMFTERALLTERDSLQPESRLDLERSQASAVRMQSLIKDLLLLYSLQESPPLSPVDPAAPLGEALDLLDLKITEQKADVTFESLPAIMADRASLVHVFHNLIGNALKFVKGRPEVRVSGETMGDKVRITISDNGVGIAPEDRERIFNPFQRGVSAEGFSGSGIGLSIVRRVMDLHGGTIEVGDAPGGGAAIHLFFKKASIQAPNRG
ncbi:sensor histidine kinase [Flaviaesturariibacter amylovorans]|uniref:histidine kinase n=1 Tax=Flaviaesturariibacter amylovorans TaxID=1084520 RepID=A0ABP8H5Q5_9BACT